MSLYRGEVVFDDSNYQMLVGDGKQVEAGGEVRLLTASPRPANADTSSFAVPFKSAMKVIPRNEWEPRIKEMEERKTRCSDYCTYNALDQDGIPYCWNFGVTGAAMNFRAKQGLPYVQLSSTSVGAIAANFRSRGGWEGEALEVFLKMGACTVAEWPECRISREYDTEATRAIRKYYRVLEWIEAESFDEFMTLLLLGIPCPVAYNWWRHVVYLSDPVLIEPGSFGVRLRNSWSDGWGAKNELGKGGFAVGREGRYSPSSGFGLSQMVAYSGATAI